MIDIVLLLHNINVYLVIAAAAITGIWGLILYFRKSTRFKEWNIALRTTVILGLLQALFGITMVISGLKPGTGTGLYYLHYVYGAITALGIPVALTYTTNGKNVRRDVLIFSIAALIIAAAAVRAWMTGPK